MAESQSVEDYSARALQFLILTTTRTGDVLGAVWDEVDLKEGVWTIPENRTKTKVEHRVPLTEEALSILEGLHRSGQYIFPSMKEGKPLSNMAMLAHMRRMDFGTLCASWFSPNLSCLGGRAAHFFERVG